MEQILRDQGWEPESNICRCGHKGGDHSSWGNRCLICDDDTFASFSEKELWANAVSTLKAAGVTLAPTPPAAPTSAEIAAMAARKMAERAATPAPLDVLVAADHDASWLPTNHDHPVIHESNREGCGGCAHLANFAATPAPAAPHPGENHDEAADAALARAEEAVEALESLSGWVTWSEDLAPAAQQYVDREAVLAVIRGERTHA